MRVKTLTPPTKMITNLNRSLSIALVIGGLLLSSNEASSQQRGKNEPSGRSHAPAKRPQPGKVEPHRAAPKAAPKISHNNRSPRGRMPIQRGKWTGVTLLTLPTYRNHDAFTRLPIEAAVQIELQYLGHYHGPIDGNIGPGSVRAIISYQRSNGLVSTGNIDRALLKSLNIID